MASRDSNAAKLTPSKSPRTRNASAAAAAAARTPPPHTNKTPHAKTPTPKKRSGGAAKADDDNEPPKPVVSRFELQFEPLNRCCTLYTHYYLYRPPGNWTSPGRPLFSENISSLGR